MTTLSRLWIVITILLLELQANHHCPHPIFPQNPIIDIFFNPLVVYNNSEWASLVIGVLARPMLLSGVVVENHAQLHKKDLRGTQEFPSNGLRLGF